MYKNLSLIIIFLHLIGCASTHLGNGYKGKKIYYQNTPEYEQQSSSFKISLNQAKELVKKEALGFVEHSRIVGDSYVFVTPIKRLPPPNYYNYGYYVNGNTGKVTIVAPKNK